MTRTTYIKKLVVHSALAGAFTHTRKGTVMSTLSDRISAIPDSGFKVAQKQKRKQKTKLAAARDFLETDWEAWKRGPSIKPGKLIPRRLDWDETGVVARMAYAVMLQSRTELIESIQNTEDETTEELLFRLASEKERLLGIVAMMDAAFTRVQPRRITSSALTFAEHSALNIGAPRAPGVRACKRT